MHTTINIKRTKINFNKNKTYSKNKAFIDKSENYKLFEFNLRPLIKQSLKAKNKIILNTRNNRTFYANFKINEKDENNNNDIKMENKIVSVNMDNEFRKTK